MSVIRFIRSFVATQTIDFPLNLFNMLRYYYKILHKKMVPTRIVINFSIYP